MAAILYIGRAIYSQAVRPTILRGGRWGLIRHEVQPIMEKGKNQYV